MTSARRGVALTPMETRRDVIVRAAVLADDLGYETFSRPSPRHGTIPAEAQIVLEQLAAYGTAGQVREQLEPWDRAADIVTILLPPGLPWSTVEATLRAAAPGF